MCADRRLGEHTNERQVTTSLGCSGFLAMLLVLHLDKNKTWLRIAAIGQRETRIFTFPGFFHARQFQWSMDGFSTQVNLTKDVN